MVQLPSFTWWKTDLFQQGDNISQDSVTGRLLGLGGYLFVKNLHEMVPDIIMWQVLLKPTNQRC